MLALQRIAIIPKKYELRLGNFRFVPKSFMDSLPTAKAIPLAPGEKIDHNAVKAKVTHVKILNDYMFYQLVAIMERFLKLR